LVLRRRAVYMDMAMGPWYSVTVGHLWYSLPPERGDYARGKRRVRDE